MMLGRLLALVAILALATPVAAGAQTTATQSALARAADALQNTSVYADPEADPGLSPAEVDRIRDLIRTEDAGPMYVAVLPADALDATGGDPEEALRRLAGSVRRPGTYVLLAERNIRAGATQGVLPRGAAGDLAREAAQANQGGTPAAVLEDFVRRVGDVRAGGGRAGRDGGGGGNGDGSGALVVLAVIAGGGGFVLWRRRRRQRREEEEEMRELKEHVRDDLVALGEDIRALEVDAELGGKGAQADYHRAVELYTEAEETWERARAPEDLEPVGRLLEEGRYAMTAAKARLEGREPPEHRAPCFFDPRHGPSTRDVEWAPPYGAPRPVPACEADAQAVERGGDPRMREIVVGGERRPYWDAPPMYAPYAGGFFGGFGGGLLPGLLIGSMLGHAFTPHAAFGDDFGGGGDSGGGDFGGGDFGGGDFGGGDFGGGDFGGGGDF